MCCSSQSSPVVKLAKIWLTIGLVTSAVPFSQVVIAAPAPAPAEPAASATVPANPESLGITIFWAGAALFACAAAVGGIILARKLHQQKALVAAGAVAAPAAQKSFSLPSNGKGNGSKPFRLNHRPAKTGKLVNNHANGNGKDNAKRRRMFNYHKFYTEMVLQGPSPSTVAENAYNPYAGYYVEYEPPRINNNGNGHNGSHNGNGNGNGNGHHDANGHYDANGHADLLATQKSLIQNQQRLIDEQARLIEEKSRLIAEKNQLLERQSQMLDNNLL
jgi:hypothetical protein